MLNVMEGLVAEDVFGVAELPAIAERARQRLDDGTLVAGAAVSLLTYIVECTNVALSEAKLEAMLKNLAERLEVGGHVGGCAAAAGRACVAE